jgi:hypothetical protein
MVWNTYCLLFSNNDLPFEIARSGNVSMFCPTDRPNF